MHDLAMKSGIIGLTLVVTATLYATPLGIPPSFTMVGEETLPAKPLRGYGSLAGQFAEFSTAAAKHASVTVIQSPTPDLAAIVLAKYNSDLRELDDVTESNLSIGSARIPIAMTGNQGAISAFRQKATVTIAAADDPETLSGILQYLPASHADFTGGKVPVYMDAFDRYGFDFYYSGWEPPKAQWYSYDYLQDFSFAKTHQVSLLFPAQANDGDTAEGIINWPRFEANVDIARKLGIPANISSWAKTGPAWLMSRYPGQMQVEMPDFVGSLHGLGYDHGIYPPACPACFSRNAEDTLLDILAPVIRKYSHYENVTGYLEPHEEAANATLAIMSTYGPVADAAYQVFLRHKYLTMENLSLRWRAGASGIKSWKDVHVPELASFIGWEPSAFDLKGYWHVTEDAALSPAACSHWQSTALDDSKWDLLMAPGDDHALFRPATHAPGIFRRRFNLPPLKLGQLKAAGHGRIYLYVWDMEWAQHCPMEAALNGVVAGHFENPTYDGSWCAFDVSTNLQAGTNLIALHLPYGELCYKTYLSPRAPRCYPDLEPGEDARWVDFRDFVTSSQGDGVRRGMEMIRREDSSRFIRLPSPNAELDAEKALAEDFGGEFHNTGYMSGFWRDDLPSLMRSSGLPFTLEPGSGPNNLTELKTFFGRWSTEGVNAVVYYRNMSDFQRQPELSAWFDTNLPLIHLFGKYHCAPALVAVQTGEESVHLTGFPWDEFSNDLNWGNRRAPLQVIDSLPAPRDMILDSDFTRGNADKYHVIIDDNTLIMDDTLIASIEKWVRAGGIFITYGHSGQHSPLAANAWPISHLTGYGVTGETEGWGFHPIPGETVMNIPLWNTKRQAVPQPDVGYGFGLFLKKMAPECQDVLAWDKGHGIALGVRPLGKGWVISDACYTKPEVWPDLLRWCGIHTAILTAKSCRVARFIANNGLDDVLVLWGEKITNASVVNLTVDNCPDNKIRDVISGQIITGKSANGQVIFSNLTLNALETRAFLVPRHAIATAPLEWLQLQRDWWQGTHAPAPAPPAQTFPNTIDLSSQCAFSPIPDNATNLAPWVAANVADHSWSRMNLGIWSAAYPKVKSGVFRKQFMFPARWKQGSTWLWLSGWNVFTLRPPFEAEAFLDGNLVWKATKGRYDYMMVKIPDEFMSGPHVLALVTHGNTTMNGFLGNAWLEHLPAPALTQSLAGDWGSGTYLPGTASLLGAEHAFVPLPSGRGKDVMFYADGTLMPIGIYINGHWLGRSSIHGDHFKMDLTPFIQWNADNRLELRQIGLEPMTVSHIEIRYYNPELL